MVDIFLSRKFLIHSTICICNILAELLAYLSMRVLIVPVLFVCGALGNAKYVLEDPRGNYSVIKRFFF